MATGNGQQRERRARQGRARRGGRGPTGRASAGRAGATPCSCASAGRRTLRANTSAPTYGVFAPDTATLADVARVAGTRWAIEVGFEAAKQEVGLDEDEARKHTGWYR